MISAIRHTTGSPIRLLSAVRNGRRRASQRQQRSQRTSRSIARNRQSILVLCPSLCPAVFHRVAKTHREPTIHSKDLKTSRRIGRRYASQRQNSWRTPSACMLFFTVRYQKRTVVILGGGIRANNATLYSADGLFNAFLDAKVISRPTCFCRLEALGGGGGFGTDRKHKGGANTTAE
jgi:hypothetical protein